jgi:hypothetical protein
MGGLFHYIVFKKGQILFLSFPEGVKKGRKTLAVLRPYIYL